MPITANVTVAERGYHGSPNMCVRIYQGDIRTAIVDWILFSHGYHNFDYIFAVSKMVWANSEWPNRHTFASRRFECYSKTKVNQFSGENNRRAHLKVIISEFTVYVYIIYSYYSLEITITARKNEVIVNIIHCFEHFIIFEILTYFPKHFVYFSSF